MTEKRLVPIDVWNVNESECIYCNEPIHSTPMIPFGIKSPKLCDITHIWTHVASGHEKCTGQETLATPTGGQL